MGHTISKINPLRERGGGREGGRRRGGEGGKDFLEGFEFLLVDFGSGKEVDKHKTNFIC